MRNLNRVSILTSSPNPDRDLDDRTNVIRAVRNDPDGLEVGHTKTRVSRAAWLRENEKNGKGFLTMEVEKSIYTHLSQSHE